MLNPQDVQMSNAVVTYILNVCSKQAIVLFDSGATHSFVSLSFAACLNKEMCILDNPLMVLTPTREVYSISKVMKECAVRIENDILEFDVILGMDWLSFNHAVLDCYKQSSFIGNGLKVIPI